MQDVDGIAPGVSAAYDSLKDSDGQGIYTSLGRFYNHTIFGRDASMTAKFVTEFDPETAWQTIVTLASYQGLIHNPRTAESPGRIHHEMRDFRLWHGGFYNRIIMNIAGLAWGVKKRQLLTYYAADPTSTYIRLINKYIKLVDPQALERKIIQKDGSEITLKDSVIAAANWITGQVDGGVFTIKRQNRFSLPYQTFMDSVTAYTFPGKQAANSAEKHSYIESHAYALDALTDANRLLGEQAPVLWKNTVARMVEATFREFWVESRQELAPAIFKRRRGFRSIDTTMISSGFALNTSFWADLPPHEYQKFLTGIVRRLFADDMLTKVGIRSKSTDSIEPLSREIDYHGSRTVWPMFNFMIIEGLRRHGLYKLAEQLENRLLNGINCLGGFPEFMIIDHKNRLYRPDARALRQRSGQMIPEQNIAFTVVPALVVAKRRLTGPPTGPSDGWRHALEREILANIPKIETYDPKDARRKLRPTPVRINRTWSGVRSSLHIAPVMIKSIQ